MSSMPQEARISVAASTMPRTVESERRRLRPTPRSTIFQRVGSEPSGGTIRSTRLRPPWPEPICPRMAAAGASRAALIAGARVERAPATTANTSPTITVVGWNWMTWIGTETASVYSLVTKRASTMPATRPGIAPARAAESPNER